MMNCFKVIDNQICRWCRFAKTPTTAKSVVIGLLFIPYLVGSYSCSKDEGCAGDGIANENYNMFLNNNLWANFVKKNQYSFTVKNNNTIVNNITVNSSGEKLFSQTIFNSRSGSPDCPITNNDKFYYKIYDYAIGDSNIIKIVNTGQRALYDPIYNNNIEIYFLNSIFNFRINDLLSIYVPNYSDSILFNSKWIYNVYKLKSSDTTATLYLNYEIGIIKYEKDSITWAIN